MAISKIIDPILIGIIENPSVIPQDQEDSPLFFHREAHQLLIDYDMGDETAKARVATLAQQLRDTESPNLIDLITIRLDHMKDIMSWCTCCHTWIQKTSSPTSRVRTVYLYRKWWEGSEYTESIETDHSIHDACLKCFLSLFDRQVWMGNYEIMIAKAVDTNNYHYHFAYPNGENWVWLPEYTTYHGAPEIIATISDINLLRFFLAGPTSR
ncbi:MAG: hypothetical protein V1719_01320 [Patescibacteria group bacterium]